MLPKKKNNNNFYEKVASWFYVILFLGAILYLRCLLVEMHVETTRLTEERRNFQNELERKQEENRNLQSKLQAQIEEATKDLIEVLEK